MEVHREQKDQGRVAPAILLSTIILALQKYKMLYTKKLAMQKLETEASSEKRMSFASPDTESCQNVPLRRNQRRREHRLHREDVAASIRMSLRHSHLVGPEDEVFQQFILDRLAEADEDPHVPPFDTLKTYAFEGTGSVMGSLSSLESATFDPCVSRGHILRLSPWQGEMEDETSF